jgi:hypothetical protein
MQEEACTAAAVLRPQLLKAPAATVLPGSPAAAAGTWGRLIRQSHLLLLLVVVLLVALVLLLPGGEHLGCSNGQQALWCAGARSWPCNDPLLRPLLP